jgi:hypothetical protein
MNESKKVIKGVLANVVGSALKAVHYREDLHGRSRLSLRWPSSNAPFLSFVEEENPSEGPVRTTSKTRVFGIGLSRTGTTSLSRALKQLGYQNSFHWTRNGKILGWHDFFLADAATDVPCSVQFEDLYHTFEKSKFIYTVRGIDEWILSIQKHLQADTPSELREKHLRLIAKTYSSMTKPGRRTDWKLYNLIRQVQIREELYIQNESWANAYEVFDRRVRHFFRDKPDEKLLEMNIAEGDSWDVLCPFLGVDIPDVPFPHANQSG